MTAESLWDLFVRTGLPEAYSLYRRSTSCTAGSEFGQPFREPFWAERHQPYAPPDQTQGT